MSAARSPSGRCASAQAEASDPQDLGLGLGQRRQRQDACADPARAAAAARGRAAGADPVPHLHQSGGGQYGRARLQELAGWTSLDDEALERGDRRMRRARAGPAGARLRAAICSRARSRRRAGSRSRRSTPSASGCCSSSRSRPMSRRISGCIDENEAADSCSRRATGRSRRSRSLREPRRRSTWSRARPAPSASTTC